MKKEINPWLPWKDTIRLPASTDKGNILVIIPTAGNDIEMLRKCLDSLKFAASGKGIHVVIVLSPTALKKKEKLEKLFGKDAEIISLRGSFNYCRSINTGLSFRNKKDRYALFLNDDVTFTKKGDLHELKKTLRKQRWACVGPFINYNPNRYDPTWPKEKSSLGVVPRTSGAIRTNLPLSGSCSLWDLEWLDKIGKLDEEFGRGWGMDEADLCIRVLRLGARYGRQDTVTINHIMHATLGEKFTRYTGPVHMRSLNYFKKKYGKEIEEWGKSYHWFPLPGIQVIMFPCKNQRKFRDCLNKIERDLEGFRWILLVGDNTNKEIIYNTAKKHCQKNSSADKCIIRKFDNKKLYSKDIFKKIVIIKSPIGEQYPVIYLVDANKKIPGSYVKELLWQIRDKGILAGKIGKEKTISEEIFPNIKFVKFKTKHKKYNHVSGSIFHIKTIIKNSNEKIH